MRAYAAWDSNLSERRLPAPAPCACLPAERLSVSRMRQIRKSGSTRGSSGRSAFRRFVRCSLLYFELAFQVRAKRQPT
jgi:hypothetical protein